MFGWFPFGGQMQSYCQGKKRNGAGVMVSCVGNVYRTRFCDDCVVIRTQHQTSHERDGHSRQRIEMCPLCEQQPLQEAF